ncbi:MAG: hypothetical protein KDI38_24985, partial [Calditrichaeota bacterium]|nr:hypothetical protein [Calditrichota bacterium]
MPHILQSAEAAFTRLTEIFNYQPAGKILLMTADFSDYGSAGAITVPQNFIRLDIAPMELGYENIPYHDRIQWLLNHELVHIFINDQASTAESVSRSLFSRVAPAQDQPLSVCYSLLTNHSRYTPRWHQEGIAVFLETWLSGGFGRVLGNFDEMYFRTLAIEGKTPATAAELETGAVKESFLLGTLHYLYGARFMAYLAATDGADKLLAWFQIQPGQPSRSFAKKFGSIFGRELQDAWQDFMRSEIEFQQANIARLNAAPLTPSTPLQDNPLGWVTQPYLDAANSNIIFGYHRPHQLTALSAIDVKTHVMNDFGTLPTPSMIQIASTAYDPELQWLFYTTNNSKLFRDVHVRDLSSGTSRVLFHDARVGQLTVAPKTQELWGIRHAGGSAVLVYSAHPYHQLVPVMEFGYGDEIQHLAASPSGRFLAATLHQADGSQSVILADLDQLKKSGRFRYQTISNAGSPEFPSWSADESHLYWNAYTNGVSNIYRADRQSGQVEAMSHTLRGLFRPVYLSPDSLFAFEFSSEGFIPVIIPNRPAAHLPAIQYFGQKVVDRNPYLTRWTVQHNTSLQASSPAQPVAANYNSLAQLKVQSMLPVISGFQGRTVAGIYTHIADPLYVHDLTLEGGFSGFGQFAPGTQYHFKGRYEFRRKYSVEFSHNAASFYDLFNQRKAGFEGELLSLGHTRYWKFDEPHKITQTTRLSLYRGVKAIHDNTVALPQSDFASLETVINSRSLRRAIGSVDSEYGDTWALTMTALG